MFRDGNTVYYVSKGYGGHHNKMFLRPNKKENYTEYAKQVKSEINKLKKEIYFLERKLRETKNKNFNEINMILKEKIKELSFWQNEMNQFDNLSSHKSLKRKTKKVNKEKLKDMVIELIQEAITSNIYYLTKEDVAFRLEVKVKDLDKIFMELNRDGILSQAKHSYMHDSIRGGNYPLLPDDRSDWAGDIYYIRKE